MENKSNYSCEQLNRTNTLRYQCRKVVNEITNNSMTDKEKVSAVLNLYFKT